jgi:integrase
MATARKRGRGYEIRVYCGLDMNARRIDKTYTWIPDEGMSQLQIKKELERQKILFEEKVKNGKCYDDNMRFFELVEIWIEDYAQPQLAIKTFARYQDFLKRILPAIGYMKLRDIKAVHLNQLYRNLGEDGINKKAKRDSKGNIISNGNLAPKTILEHHRLVSKILATAVRWQIIEKNVAPMADPPKVPYREMQFLNETEIQQIITLLNDEPVQYKTMINLLIFTGIRRGELCGLEWKDIDFDNSTMQIMRSSQYIGNGQIVPKEPKTRSGRRKFVLSDTLIRLLKSYRKFQLESIVRLGDQWVSTDRLFTTWNGKPIHPDTVTSWFAKFLKRSEIRKVTLHSLRHTNATLMIAEGVDVCTVSNRLGHANTSTTLNIYAHALKSRDSEAAEKLDNIFSSTI